MTHTFATMEISKSAFSEIMDKLREAGYDHAIQFEPDIEGPVLDMSGIALCVDVDKPLPEKIIDMGIGEVAVVARATGEVELESTLVDGDMDIAAVAYLAAFYVMLTQQDVHLISVLQANLAANGVFEAKVKEQ